MVLAWNLSFGVEIKFWRGVKVSPPGSGKEDVLGPSARPPSVRPPVRPPSVTVRPSVRPPRPGPAEPIYIKLPIDRHGRLLLVLFF